MAGDFGFDPLGLGKQGEDRLKWCVHYTSVSRIRHQNPMWFAAALGLAAARSGCPVDCGESGFHHGSEQAVR